MTFIEHTVTWLRGEAFEMLLLSIVGVGVLAVAALVWKFGTTPVAQALPIPLTLVAGIFLAAGLSGQLSTPAKISAYSEAYAQDPVAFVKQEQQRVAGFEKTYAYTLIGAALLFALAVAIFTFTELATPRAIASVLVLVGLAALVIDMFSKERAVGYQQAINAELARQNSLQ